MKSDFFIDRPVFSTVLSIVIVGLLGLVLLPVDQYPRIVPPVVKVSASYPGASAQTVTQAVATPIEQELNGTPGMLVAITVGIVFVPLFFVWVYKLKEKWSTR